VATHDIQNLKYKAAHQALDFVRDGMILGLGSGSTAAYFIDLLGEQIRSGALRDIRAVPTSQATDSLARARGIPIISLASSNPVGEPRLDLTVDGADEVDPDLNLIKGLGRALLREKVVEIHAECFIILVDESKMVPRLGTRGPLPVEIIPFQAETHVRWLSTLGCRAELWIENDGSPVITDNHNYLARCWFEGGIPDAYSLADKLAQRPGIVEHGLFLDLATHVIVASQQGLRIIERSRR